jgi:ABC-type dipeptide/oligopeptide/nickel transport system permease component
VGVTIVVFLLLHASGDPAQMMLGQHATLEQITLFRQAYGLDKPLYVQYGLFVIQALQGDFGTSIAQNRPALETVLHYLPNTLLLTIVSTLIALVVAVPAGVIAGIKRNSIFDYLLMVGAVLGQSIPQFWLGLMLMLVFSVKLHWLPTSGVGSGMASVKHLILPALTLTPWFLALTARLIRSGMLEVMSQDYIRTAYAKGLTQGLVISRHAFKSAMIPLVVVIGLHLAYLIGGAIIVEIVFAWPGIGFLAYRSVLMRDYPVVLTIVTMVAGSFVVINILADIALAYIDPRIRFRGGEAQ